MTARIRLEGKRFGSWTVGDYIGANSYKQSAYRCRCDCGIERDVVSQTLRNGLSVSCGCQKPILIKAGRPNRRKDHWSPEHRAWHQMIFRVRPTSKRVAPMYAHRGITVCERWQRLEVFIEDMGPIPHPGYSLDRIDNDRGYSPDNCRWADCQTQAQNRRQA